MGTEGGREAERWGSKVLINRGHCLFCFKIGDAVIFLVKFELKSLMVCRLSSE